MNDRITFLLDLIQLPSTIKPFESSGLDNITYPHFSNRDIRHIKHFLQEKNIEAAVEEATKNFTPNYDIVKQITKTGKLDCVLYTLFVYTYSWIHNQTDDEIVFLFNTITNYRNTRVSDLVSFAVHDIFTAIVSMQSKDLFQRVIQGFSDFILFSENVSPFIIDLVPPTLSLLIQIDGLEASSLASQFSSFISLFLTDKPKCFNSDISGAIFDVIRSQLASFNPLAMLLYHHLHTFLSPQVTQLFASQIALMAEKVISKEPPLTHFNKHDSFLQYEPASSPESFFRFADKLTFTDGLNFLVPIEKPLSFHELPEHQICNSIHLITGMIGKGDIDSFLQSFINAIEHSENYKYDLCLIFIRITNQLEGNNQLPMINVPTVLFDPSLESNNLLFSLRYYTIESILHASDSNFLSFLVDISRYPVLLTEVFHIIISQIDLFAKAVSTSPMYIRTIRTIAVTLQSCEFKDSSIETSVIEEARRSLFTIINELFNRNGFITLFLNDALFLPFFLSLFFEENIRPFAMAHVSVYLSLGQVSPDFNMFLTQTLEHLISVLPDARPLCLANDIFSALNSSKSIFPEYADISRRILERMDNSKYSHALYLSILHFYTDLGELDPFLLSTLGKPLEIFDNYGHPEEAALIGVCAGRFLAPDQRFAIVNGSVLLILLKFFFKSFLPFLSLLCHDSDFNCMECHSAGVEIFLLDKIRENNNNNEYDAIESSLELVFFIGSKISSPAVVKHFLQILVPCDNKVPRAVVRALPMLSEVFRKARSIPPRYSYLKTQRQFTINRDENFSICLWLYASPSDKFLLLSMPDCVIHVEDLSIFVNGVKSNSVVVDRSWTQISFTFYEKVCNIVINGQATSQFLYRPALSLAVSIGGTEDCTARISDTYVVQGSANAESPRDGYSESSIVLKASITNKTFSDVFLLIFKATSLIPLMAQLDLPSETPSDAYTIIDVISSALLVHESIQASFYQSKGFCILAHLLMASDPKHLTLQFYIRAFVLFKELTNEDLKKQLFDQIIYNTELWIAANPSVIVQVLQHWSQDFMFDYPKYFNGNNILHIMRMYYWYKPIEALLIRGNDISSRHRSKDLPVSVCRAILAKVALFVGIEFSVLIDQIVSVTDEEQRLDLLKILLQVSMTKMPNIFSILSSPSDRIIQAIVAIILVSDKSRIKEHLDCVIKLISDYKCTPSLLELLLKLDSSETFTICAFVAYKLHDVSFLKSFEPRHDYADCTWLLHLAVEMRRDDLFQFIAKSAENDHFVVGQKLYYLARKSNIDSEEIMAQYVRCCEIVSLEKADFNVQTANLIRFHLYTRESGHTVLSKLFHHIQSEYVMGLRIDLDGNWLDSSIAHLLLEITLASKKQIRLGIITAGFLAVEDRELARNWLKEIKPDPTAYYQELQFLKYKLGEKVDMSLLPDYLTILPNMIIPDANKLLSNAEQLLKQAEQNTDKVLSQFNLSNTDSVERVGLLVGEIGEQINGDNKENSNLWVRLWTNLSVEGAPWESGKHPQIMWKRDPHLCGASLIPCKLQRLWKPDNHMQASLARDKGNPQTLEEALAQYRHALEEEYKAHAPPEILTIREEKEEDVATSEVSAKKQRSFECELIKITKSIPATLIIMEDCIHIMAESRVIRAIKLNEIVHVFQRTRCHFPTAIEILTLSGEMTYLHFPHNRNIDVIKAINLPDPILQKLPMRKYFESLPFTDEWASGEMSNFEYLMKLNMYSGRTFNDASQYPIFPWVLSDYQSDHLDFNDPSIYRDLSKPMGYLTEKRYEELRLRMNDLACFSDTPFLYSSYCSCSLSLYLYLLRMEPFTKLHINMQSGKFDHSSRQFYSVGEAYKLATTHLNDYRELIPEFFFLPDFLMNNNGLDLGTFHDRDIGEVALPPWAANPIDFVYQMRVALESDYVSEHLNEWIDLMWGVRQKDPTNLFLPEIYESAWDNVDSSDTMKRAEIEAKMTHVGQVPTQLFTSLHPNKKIIQKPKEIPPTKVIPNGFKIDHPPPEYQIVVNEEGSVRIISTLLDITIPFFGEGVSCVAVSKEYGLAICGTGTSLVFASLFEGRKLRNVNVGIKPEYIMVTKGWGLIVVYGQKTMITLMVNANLVNKRALNDEFRCWDTWTDAKGMDYVAWGGKSGKVYWFDPFRPNEEKLYRCYEAIQDLRFANGQIEAVTEDEKGFIIPTGL